MKTHPFCTVCKHGKNFDRRAPVPSASNGETMATLGATGANNRATTTGLHADEKAVGTLAANNGGLISTFHDFGCLCKRTNL